LCAWTDQITNTFSGSGRQFLATKNGPPEPLLAPDQIFCDSRFLQHGMIDTSSITINVGFAHAHPIGIPVSHFNDVLRISTICGRVHLSSNINTLLKLLSLQVCIWVWL